MDIIRAKANDVEGLVKIRLGYLTEDFGGLSKEQTDILMKELPVYYLEHLDKDFIAYVAKDNGEIVSSAFLVILEKPANPHFITGKIGNILNVFTLPQYRRQGLASRLLEMACQDAKEMNLSYLELMATAQGYPLYKKMGFTEAKSECTPMKFMIE